jgi:predicted Zn-dependent protease
MCQSGSQVARFLMLKVVASVWMLCPVLLAQEASLSWQDQVRKCAEEQNWSAAMLIVEREIQLEPEDMDVRAWRARVLLWSGRLADAEHEYLEILATDPNDPDNWMGLASDSAILRRPLREPVSSKISNMFG